MTPSLPASVIWFKQADCLKGHPIVRTVAVTAKEYPESAKALRLDAIVGVEILILPDGVGCGPKIVKTSGNLAIDKVAAQEAYRSYLQSAKADGGRSIGTYLYNVRFTPP